ncbi:MAG: hypothetical protein WCA78_00535 [Rhizomicrobium sp.]
MSDAPMPLEGTIQEERPLTAQEKRELEARTKMLARQREVSGMVKEAIGEVLFRRSRELIATDAQLHWLHLDTDDLITVVEIIGESNDLAGLADDVKLDMTKIETVGDLVDALCDAMFPAKAEAAP